MQKAILSFYGFPLVPAEIRELEKNEMVRSNNGSYKLDHAVTKPRKTILSSFGLDKTDITKSAEGSVNSWQPANHSLAHDYK